MRRLLLAVAAGAIGILAVTQIAPPPADAPAFGETDITVPEGAVASPSAWYCPWVAAGDVVDSDIVVASEPDVTVGYTLLDPVANADPSTASAEIIGPGAAVLNTGSVLRVGETPAIVEISNGPATVASMQYADSFITADQCLVSVPKIWYLTGGSTKTGTITRLRLFNPFADNAEVTITAYSEFNLDLVAELDGLDVAGRDWTTIDFEPYLPFRDELAFTVTTTKGLVIPALVRTDDRGEAMWPGVAPHDTWEFPVVSPGELAPQIAVMSAGDEGVVVSVDIVTEDGTIRNAREVVLDSSTPALIPLADLAAPPFGARIRATAPIAASAVATVPEDDVEGGEGGDPSATTTTTTDDTTTTTEFVEETFISGLAGTIGSARPSSNWIVPVDSLPGADTTLWIMNSSSEPVSVSFGPLGEIEYSVLDLVQVPAESIVGIPVDVGIGIYGYIVEADRPVSVAWEIAGDRGVALVAGVPTG
ncbi:MAG: DUF5719 family protein [Acidimicrobiia bacterium]